MRLSCNGCRILRKGCGDDCIIKPCLDWINSPDCQANATLFLAKFYGRTGLLNLLTAAPQNLAPAVFKSLLYEACGRLVNPTYGSLGLFWDGEWARCEAAVEAILTGSKIVDVAAIDWQTSETLVSGDHMRPNYDIRHVARGTNVNDVREKTQFKRGVGQVLRPKPRVGLVDSGFMWTSVWESESVEIGEASSSVSQGEPDGGGGETGVNLDLTLGFGCKATDGKNMDY